MHVRPEMVAIGSLLTSCALVLEPLGCEKILITHQEMQDVLAGLKSASYKAKRSNRTLSEAKLEMEILSQCGESTLKDFKPSRINHGKVSHIGQMISVEYNRLTMSETVR